MKDVSSRNLQVRLLVLVFLAFIPALGIFWYANRQLHALQLQAKEQDLLQRASEVASDYRNLVEKGRAVLGTLSEFDAIRSIRSPACTDHLTRVQEHLKGFTTVSVIGLDGHLACGSLTPENDLDLGDRAYFIRASSRGGFAVGEFALGRITGKPVVGLALPLDDGSGTVVAASMDLEALAHRSRGDALPTGYTISVLDRNRRIMVRLPTTGNFTRADSVGAIAGPDFPAPPEGPSPRLALGLDLDGIERLFAVAPLRDPGGTTEGYLAVGRTMATLMEEVDDIVGLQLRFLAIGGIVLLAVAWALGHFWLVRPPPEEDAEAPVD